MLLVEYLSGKTYPPMPATAVQLTLWASPSSDERMMNPFVSGLAVALRTVGVANGQITKLPVVLDSLRKPVAFGRTPVFVVGMLSWQVAPGTTMVCRASAAVAAGTINKQ